MATVVAAPASAPHHNGFAAFHHQQHQLPQYRVPAVVHHNPFEAFAPRHHSGAKSASAATSWRHTEPVERAPVPVPTRTPPKNRRGSPTHSRTPSTTSSEASSSSWRDRSRSPAVATVELQPAAVQQPKPTASGIPVYSFAELLGLSASPLVGIGAESKAVVDDLVAHHVWRRGPQSGASKGGKRRRNPGTSKQRSSSPSSGSSTADDSERID